MRLSRKQSRFGFTLVEVQMAIAFLILIIAVAGSIHFFGLRMFQATRMTLEATDDARNFIGSVRDEIRSCTIVQVGKGDFNTFAEIPDDTKQIGNALQIFPGTNLTKYTIDLIDVLDDDAKLLNFLRMERWIADRPDHPGEVVRQWFKDLYQENKLIKNELVLGERKVDLRNVTMPVLNIYATGDTIIPVSCSKGVGDHFGTKDYTELAVPGGHIGTFVGSKAQKILAPSLADWFRKRSG